MVHQVRSKNMQFHCHGTTDTDGLKYSEGRRIQPCYSRVIILCDLWPFPRFVPNSWRSLAGGCSFPFQYSMLYLERTGRNRCAEPFQPYGSTIGSRRSVRLKPCDQNGSCISALRESALNSQWGEKSLAAPGSRIGFSISPDSVLNSLTPLPPPPPPPPPAFLSRYVILHSVTSPFCFILSSFLYLPTSSAPTSLLLGIRRRYKRCSSCQINCSSLSC